MNRFKIDGKIVVLSELSDDELFKLSLKRKPNGNYTHIAIEAQHILYDRQMPFANVGFQTRADMDGWYYTGDGNQWQ